MLPTQGSAPAAAPLAPCRTADLRTTFRGGGLGTGNDFGTLVVWNAGDRPCRLRGRAGFTASWATGGRDEAAGTDRPVLVSADLPARSPAPRAGADLSGGPYLQAFLQGPERDDPRRPDGLCRAQDELTPASLRLTVGGVVLVQPNRDPDPGQVPAVYGCHGVVLLVQVQGPLGPA